MIEYVLLWLYFCIGFGVYVVDRSMKEDSPKYHSLMLAVIWPSILGGMLVGDSEHIKSINSND